mgnify:CR=1 FL=1
MPATHNVVIAEEYESNGETKTSWKTIGVIIETEKDGKKRPRMWALFRSR